uniref:Uncharacterized protein n=1 Tax=Anopheles minimus TaxID=112268 RepID=A0A182WM62_9DIPT
MSSADVQHSGGSSFGNNASSNPYALKDSGPTSDMTAWTSAGLQPTTGYYPYDPTLAAYG